jgi:ATP-dependent exoDNAse (exonuclease V) beta subunit
VHGALERWDSGASIDDALARALAGLRANLGSLTDAARLDECEHEARAVLESFARSALAERLRALAPRTLGRELPILVASDADDAPLVGWSGAADLVYEDASDVVVADFKTDRVDAAALEQHAAHYAQQGRVYVRAVERALGRRARFELWFLRAGRVVALDVS